MQSNDDDSRAISKEEREKGSCNKFKDHDSQELHHAYEMENQLPTFKQSQNVSTTRPLKFSSNYMFIKDNMAREYVYS